MILLYLATATLQPTTAMSSAAPVSINFVFDAMVILRTLHDFFINGNEIEKPSFSTIHLSQQFVLKVDVFKINTALFLTFSFVYVLESRFPFPISIQLKMNEHTTEC